MAKWTKEQEAAITCKDKNLLVSAAAGAGKTAVLVERIMRRIVDAEKFVDVDRLLVVTFTNAAAQEMKDRIARELMSRQKEDRYNKNLKRQLLLLGKSAISTLHSFCLDLIRQNYYLLSLPGGLVLDPHFRIIDDTEAVLLKLEVLEKVFEERYALEEDGFLKLVECFGGERDDRTLQDLVLKIYDFSRSHPDPALWLAALPQSFRVNIEDSSVQELFLNLIDSIIQQLEEAIFNLEEAEKLCGSPHGPAIYLSNLQQERESLQQTLLRFVKADKGSAWQNMLESLGGLKFNSLKPCRDKEVDTEIKNEVLALRDSAKETIKKIQKEFCIRTPQEFLIDMQEMYPLMDSLCLLAIDFDNEYLKAKLGRNKLDFADLEHFALELLKTAAIAQRLRERFVEVMVDEYQDINCVQEAILQLVSKGNETGNLFMVGDVKQSIYGFRLAEPGLFLAKYNQFAKSGSATDSIGEKIVLSSNFRSRNAIVNGVNFIFRQIMAAKIGGIAYDRDAELIYGAVYPKTDEEVSLEAGAIEVHIIERAKGKGNEIEEQSEIINEEEENKTEDFDSAQLEARLIGKKIQALLEQKHIYDKELNIYRPIKYSDIVVLMRSIKSSAPLYLEEFSRMAIPAYAEVGTGYLGAQEVQTMLALLKLIDNPRQDIPLVAVLRSPIIGLTPDELADIRIALPKGEFYNAVRLAVRRNRGEFGIKLRDFLKKLRSWRTFSRRHSLVELVWLIYRETGYYDYTGALPGGRQRQANLRALQDRAKQYEETSMKGLFKFLRFLEELEEKNQDLGAARPLGEKENVVRIMSIHKSKGLEFPVVILAGVGKLFNRQDLREDILVDKDLGLGPVWVDCEKRLKYPTLARIAVKNKLKRELLAEEIRILYVAMTRARESLIIVGAINDIYSKLKKWQRIASLTQVELPSGFLSSADCFLDWLVPCLIRHRSGQSIAELLKPKISSIKTIYEDFSKWDIHFWNPQLLQEQLAETKKEANERLTRIAELLPLNEDSGLGGFVESRLSWQYPYSMLANIPAKFSVTEIKHRIQQNIQDHSADQLINYERKFTQRPKFLQAGQGLSAEEKGSALHLLMRHLDLSASLTEDDIQKQAELMVQNEIISPIQRDSLSYYDIAGFFQSSLGKRIKNSPKVMREIPFMVMLPATQVLDKPDIPLEEKILVQGTADCLFEEQDSYIILDYKTDMVTQETIVDLKERYRMQLDIYAHAIEAIMKKPVREKILYSFTIGEALVL